MELKCRCRSQKYLALHDKKNLQELPYLFLLNILDNHGDNICISVGNKIVCELFKKLESKND